MAALYLADFLTHRPTENSILIYEGSFALLRCVLLVENRVIGSQVPHVWDPNFKVASGLGNLTELKVKSNLTADCFLGGKPFMYKPSRPQPSLPSLTWTLFQLISSCQSWVLIAKARLLVA